MKHNIGYSFIYSYAKSLDQVSNGDLADGAANQTNPGNNRSEYGPSDYDFKHRVVATALYQTPNLHTHSSLLNTLGSGFQVNGTYTYHTGFPWTPVTGTLNTVPVVNGAAVQNICAAAGLLRRSGNQLLDIGVGDRIELPEPQRCGRWDKLLFDDATTAWGCTHRG